MKKYKRMLIHLPEYYLIALALMAGFTPPFTINPIAIGIVAILALQIIFKSKIAGHLIASFFLIGNLFMLFALTSELNEFPRFNAHAKELLLGGLMILGFNIFISGLMFVKYSLQRETTSFQSETELQQS